LSESVSEGNISPSSLSRPIPHSCKILIVIFVHWLLSQNR
jgi:hypothetical protein